ncbi:unnamed protein product [Sphagnum tenellum]
MKRAAAAAAAKAKAKAKARRSAENGWQEAAAAALAGDEVTARQTRQPASQPAASSQPAHVSSWTCRVRPQHAPGCSYRRGGQRSLPGRAAGLSITLDRQACSARVTAGPNQESHEECHQSSTTTSAPSFVFQGAKCSTPSIASSALRCFSLVASKDLPSFAVLCSRLAD